MKVVHSWLKDYVGDSIPSPDEIERLLTLHAFEIEGVEQVEGEDVIEVKILPDRGSDCLSHRGIARELSSITGIPLVNDPLMNKDRLPAFSDIQVNIADTHACSRFSAALVSGIEVKDSPLWLQARLRALGQRPINNIVDATNYVMYSLGQPLHAYDAEKFPKVDGKWQFSVRFAQKEEQVSLIAEGGKQEDRILTLLGTELLIVDASSNRPIGLAGIKGGAYAPVNSATTQIIIEAAHFDPVITRKTARRLGIVIDGSKRFENNPSSELVPHALRDVVELIMQIAGGTCLGSIDEDHSPQEQAVVDLAVSQVNALLGLSLSKKEMIDILRRIGAEVADRGEVLSLISPFERSDLNIAEDYIEEIGRINGYDQIVSVVPPAVPLLEINKRHYYSEKIRSFLVERGFSEIITSSFANKDEIQLQNALARDKSFVRSNLSVNMEDALNKNGNLLDLLGALETRIFEIGTVFVRKEGSVSEYVSLSIGVRTKVSGYTAKDDSLVTEILAQLEDMLGEKLNATIKKGIAECNLSAFVERLSQPAAYDLVEIAKEISYKPFSSYPAISRDIAMWVTQGTDPEEVKLVLEENATKLRVRTTLVDVFTKEGKTSYAFRLVFQSYEKTLTDEEVNAVMANVYAAVHEKGWEVR
jgi:phenylalanyl-tRNA synthetase beta chain